MVHTIKTKISVHSYNLFNLFMNANFGEAVDVGYYSFISDTNLMAENLIMYSYNDDNLDFEFVRMKFAFNGHNDIEKAFLEYEHALRHSIF